MKNVLKEIGSALGSLFMFLFGSFDFLLKAIIVLMLLDYITGVCSSFVENKVNSSIGAKGIVKKVGYLCVITISVILDQLLNTGGSLRTLIISIFIFNEMLSILENSSRMGIKIPDFLYKSLEKLNLNDKKDK